MMFLKKVCYWRLSCINLHLINNKSKTLYLKGFSAYKLYVYMFIIIIYSTTLLQRPLRRKTLHVHYIGDYLIQVNKYNAEVSDLNNHLDATATSGSFINCKV